MTDTDRKLAEEIYYTLCDKYLEAKDRSEIVTMAMDEYFPERLKSLVPTDEEIIESIFKDDPVKDGDSEWLCGYRQGQITGAKWMREKLTGKSEEKQKTTCTCGIPTPDADRECCMVCGNLIYEEDKDAPFDEEIK